VSLWHSSRGKFNVNAFAFANPGRSPTDRLTTPPAQIIVGDQDKSTLPEAGSHMENQMPASNLMTFAPAKHLGFFEQHNRFNKELRQFASDCFARDTSVTPTKAK
jgi:pimeloyl-ACP methyl ester carboxylesterase